MLKMNNGMIVRATSRQLEANCANCYRTKSCQWNELKLYMLHYWCLADLHTKFHASAATRRSAATCWKIGCYQQLVKLINFLVEILYFVSLELPWLFWKGIPIKTSTPWVQRCILIWRSIRFKTLLFSLLKWFYCYLWRELCVFITF